MQAMSLPSFQYSAANLQVSRKNGKEIYLLQYDQTSMNIWTLDITKCVQYKNARDRVHFIYAFWLLMGWKVQPRYIEYCQAQFQFASPV